MVVDVTPLSGRDAVLAAAAHHPYARLTTGGDGDVRGFTRPGLVAWTGPGPRGPAAWALGDADPAARLFARMAAGGELDGVAHVHLPRHPHARLARVLAGLPIAGQDDWDFRWSRRTPPARPGEDRVELLGPPDEARVADLLDRAHTGSTARPGHPRVLAWYGIRAGDRLLACGSDCSRGGIGFLAGLTVDTDVRGRGLGAALTAAMTRLLFSRYGCVGLGVMSDNDLAIGLYIRLGFTDSLARSTVILAR
jgi:ribosomal protein S18 acetylase RimI-like enzyme